MSTLVERLLGVPPWAVILVVGALVLAEDALFVGFVLPGETAAVHPTFLAFNAAGGVSWVSPWSSWATSPESRTPA